MLETTLATPVTVSQAVLDGITDIRDSGMISMFDYHGVVDTAKDLGHHEAHAWLASNQGLYSKGIFAGFNTEEPVSDVLN